MSTSGSVQIIERDGKLYREIVETKTTLEELPDKISIEYLLEKIKALEGRIQELEDQPKITINPTPICPCPCPKEVPYVPNPLIPDTTPWYPYQPIYICEGTVKTYISDNTLSKDGYYTK